MVAIIATSFMVDAQSVNTIDDPFFDKVSYVGAFGEEDWTEGWANFDPQNTAYPATNQIIAAGNITTDTEWSSSNSPVNNRADWTNPRLADPFFEKVNFVGAFGTNDWTEGWANFDPQNTNYPATTATINAGNITTNITWTANNVYLLNGWVYVKDGATLTIEAGTIIRGDKNNQGALIVERGGKLIAQGTADAPIVFTSNQPAGFRDKGDWGGVIVLGKAIINVPGGEATIEGGVGSTFGGSDDADNSGVLSHLRIEYPGVAFSPNNEINGLTMGGVGTGTQIDHIQVSYSGDDAYEWFGGKVNAKYLIALGTFDDDFDTDFGYTGMLQFLVSLRHPQIANDEGSRTFESDNDGDGSNNTPITRPLFANVSAFGPADTPGYNENYNFSIYIRRNSACSIYNSIFTSAPKGLRINDASQTQATNNNLQIENTFLAGMTTNFHTTFDQNYFNNVSRNNETYATSAELSLAAPFNLTNPDFRPATKTYLLNGWVYVKDGATLTIDPGTIIRGDKNNQGALIVERGGMLIAEGTKDEPIVFTSNQPAGARNAGDWGGVIVLGKAIINVPGGEATIEGGVGSVFGGIDDNDNSGILKYIRIEYPGIAFSPNNEINGLTMGGVGDGTVIDYIQVSYCGDDAFEWFGGFVNAKHLIAFSVFDDDFDTDFGYRGMVQYAVGLRNPAIANDEGSRHFESDNDGDGSSNTPITQPIFSNVSGFGPSGTSGYNENFNYDIYIRRNSACNIYNSLFTAGRTGLRINDASQQQATNGNLKIENTIMGCMANSFYNTTFDETYFTAEERNNQAVGDCGDLMLQDPYNLSNPEFLPQEDSPVLFASNWTNVVSGVVMYGNNASTPLPGVMVSIRNQGGDLVTTTTTNASGEYEFRVLDGIYTLTGNGSGLTWGGVNIIDGLRIRQKLVGQTTFTALQEAAANVDQNTVVNILDYVTLRQKIAGLNPPAWKIPNYVFEIPVITVSGGNITKNFKGLCGGDVDGSYNPAQPEEFRIIPLNEKVDPSLLNE